MVEDLKGAVVLTNINDNFAVMSSKEKVEKIKACVQDVGFLSEIYLVLRGLNGKLKEEKKKLIGEFKDQ